MDQERTYRAYLIGIDGRIRSGFDLDCDNDETAKKRAKELVDGHDVELWDGSRKIAEFKTSERKAPFG